MPRFANKLEPHDRGDKILHHATLAARLLTKFSDDNSNNPYLKGIAGISLLLLETVQTVKTNRSQCLSLIERIHEIITAIINLCGDAGSSLSPAILRSLAQFFETLQKVYAFIRSQQNTGMFKRILRATETAALLEDCNKGLEHAVNLFKIQARLMASAEIAQARTDAEKRYDELADLIGKQGHSTSTLSTSVYSSSSSLCLLPSSPQIFYGRDREVDFLLKMLVTTEPFRMAILGPGGIGKSSLALAVLHHENIISHFGALRYFISLESSASASDMIAAIGAFFGIEPNAKISRAIIRYISDLSAPCVIVLDNLEDCWESGTSRSEVEEFLSLLTEIAHLQLMVTMRGAERPARVKWSRPFLPPLDRLDDMSARQTFLDIVDNIDGDELTALLALTDNLPLAITLMANVASFEGGQSVLNRWADETTGVLSEGLSKRANLEKSIMISLSSPRMLSNPNARTLLSLLSLLPEGISDTTLRQMHLPFAEDVPRSRSTLLRCSLIYAVGDGRLRVLVPIREYVRGAYPPPADAFRALCTYFYDLASLFRNPNDLPGRELIARLAGEFANVRAVTAYALAQGIDLEDTVRCTIDLLHFNASAQTTSFDFTKSVEETVEALGDPVLKGDYLLARARVTVGNMPCEELASEALRCFEEKDNLFGRVRAHYTLASHFPLNGRFQEAIDAADTGFRLAQQLGDLSAQALCLTASSKAHRNKGDLQAALAHGRKARQLSQASGNMTAEAWVSQQYATCCVVVGDYTGGSELCAAITSILSALGLADIEVHAYRNLLNVQAEIFHRRTEYEAAHALHMRILKSRRTIDDVSKAWDMLNIAQIDIELGDLAAARQKVDDARRTVTPQVFKASEMFALADLLEADLAFHRGQYKKARTGFSRALAETTWADLAIIAIEKLSNVALKTQDILSVARYSTLLLASARKAHDPAAANQALRRLGDIFLSQGDPTTARNLLQVALDGFRLMGIHRATGDCLVRMGEIWASEGQPSKAIEAFSDARPLFEKSSQAADVARCDERLAFLRRDK